MAKRVFFLLFLFILQTLGAIGRLFSQIVACLIFLFVPFQSDTYLRVYLNILQDLEYSPTKGTLWRHRIELIGILLRLKALHFLYLLLIPSQTDLDVFLHFDIVDYMIPDVAINVISILFTNLPAIVNERMFFHVQKQLLDRLVAVIHFHSNEWFLSSSYKGRPISKLLRRLYATIFNLQSTYHLSIELVIVWFESTFLCIALPHLTTLTLLWHCLSLIGFLLFANSFFFIVSLAFATLFTALAMFQIKMSQINRQLGLLIKQRHLSLRQLVHLQGTFLSTFRFFIQINSMYRWIFAAVLLSAVPGNVILTISLLLKRIQAENLPFTLFALYYTFLFIFFFHFAFAYPSKAIHRFGALFQHTLVCKYPLIGKTRIRMRLSHLIFAFLVPARDRYGFNYGNWGVVSVENFFKYLVIYSKLAMTLYKLLNK